jgi:hypothetical protein
MKTSRDQLKMIVKECLIEILSEGLGNVTSASPQASSNRNLSGSVTEQRRSGPRKLPFNAALDTPRSGRQATDALKNAVLEVARGNPMMQDMLADTAMTTLPTMLSHGDTGTGGAGSNVAPGVVQQEQFNGTPEQVFGDGANRWADLAFMEPKKQST